MGDQKKQGSVGEEWSQGPLIKLYDDIFYDILAGKHETAYIKCVEIMLEFGQHLLLIEKGISLQDSAPVIDKNHVVQIGELIIACAKMTNLKVRWDFFQTLQQRICDYGLKLLEFIETFQRLKTVHLEYRTACVYAHKAATNKQPKGHNTAVLKLITYLQKTSFRQRQESCVSLFQPLELHKAKNALCNFLSKLIEEPPRILRSKHLKSLLKQILSILPEPGSVSNDWIEASENTLKDCEKWIVTILKRDGLSLASNAESDLENLLIKRRDVQIILMRTYESRDEGLQSSLSNLRKHAIRAIRFIDVAIEVSERVQDLQLCSYCLRAYFRARKTGHEDEERTLALWLIGRNEAILSSGELLRLKKAGQTLYGVTEGLKKRYGWKKGCLRRI